MHSVHTVAALVQRLLPNAETRGIEFVMYAVCFPSTSTIEILKDRCFIERLAMARYLRRVPNTSAPSCLQVLVHTEATRIENR